MGRKGLYGTPMGGGGTMSNAARKRRKHRARAEEARWAAKRPSQAAEARWAAGHSNPEPKV